MMSRCVPPNLALKPTAAALVADRPSGSMASTAAAV
jgi:hypothetical protein